MESVVEVRDGEKRKPWYGDLVQEARRALLEHSAATYGGHQVHGIRFTEPRIGHRVLIVTRDQKGRLKREQLRMQGKDPVEEITHRRTGIQVQRLGSLACETSKNIIIADSDFQSTGQFGSAGVADDEDFSSASSEDGPAVTSNRSLNEPMDSRSSTRSINACLQGPAGRLFVTPMTGIR